MQGFGGQDASTESINVLFCLFVCPQSQKKPQGENENGERERTRVSKEMMMRKKHQRKLLEIQMRVLCSNLLNLLNKQRVFVCQTTHTMCVTANKTFFTEQVKVIASL